MTTEVKSVLSPFQEGHRAAGKAVRSLCKDDRLGGFEGQGAEEESA
jgi:hypothetical protein